MNCFTVILFNNLFLDNPLGAFTQSYSIYFY